jgi:hypothetical protein
LAIQSAFRKDSSVINLSSISFPGAEASSRPVFFLAKPPVCSYRGGSHHDRSQAGTIALAGTGGAQDFGLSGAVARFLAATATDHPAAIVDGSCTTANAKTADNLGGVTPGKTKTGDTSALAASWRQTTINASFADRVKSPYALVIAGGPKEPATVARGAITGAPTGTTLAIAIRPVGTGKDAGVAWLQETGTKTDVTLFPVPDVTA